MASCAAPASNLLASLPARPPTPPRETNHNADAASLLRSLAFNRSQAFDPRHSFQTPPSTISPVSSSANSISSSRRRRKKVEWSNHTQYKDPPEYLNGSRLTPPCPISVPPSASLQPIKGILKPSSPLHLGSSENSSLHGVFPQLDLLEMLESTIKQLAGSDRDSKLDAYMMLSRALKASDNLPDRVALRNKMTLFMQFIQRDVVARNEDGSLDASLINHALVLLVTLLHYQAIASTLTYDFGVFMLDHAIRCFQDSSTPKDIVGHVMQIVAFQDFSIKVMTADRVGRLVGALHNIERHVQGKSIVCGRLLVYNKLVKQARSNIIIHSDWLKDMFNDMLSSIKDIRAKAISLGTEAGFALRSDRRLFRKVAEIFEARNGDQEKDESYIEFYIKRLRAMLEERQTSHAVPQILAVVILFMRCPLNEWKLYSQWLTLVQAAFNKADLQTKQEANFAWNCYAYLSIMDSKPSPKMLTRLCQPLLAQLKRKANPKQMEAALRLRDVVVGGLCNLYSHVLAQRDNQQFADDMVWDVVVQPALSQLIVLESTPDVPKGCTAILCRILTGVLDTSRRLRRSLDSNLNLTPLTPEELMPIDSKWVRRNCDKVYQVAGPILESNLIDLADEQSQTLKLWKAFVGAIAMASAKDIKFVNVLVQSLGLLPFTEKKLCMNGPNTFQTVVTPSRRAGKNSDSRAASRIPLHHLFLMLSSNCRGIDDEEALASMFISIFQPFFENRDTTNRKELARELIHLVPRNCLSPFGPWVLAAENMKPWLDQMNADNGSLPPSSNTFLGPDFREVVALLERGLMCHPNLPVRHWRPLFDSISTAVAQGYGDAGRVLILVEPLAKVLLDGAVHDSDQPSNLSLSAMAMLFSVAKLPRDRQALDAARQRLWGAAKGRHGPFDPLCNLYKLGNQGLKRLYHLGSDTELIADVASVMDAAITFLDKCLPQASIKVISDLQNGICLWIEDEEEKVPQDKSQDITKTIYRFWDHICQKITSCDQLERQDVDQIEPVLTAAFKSKHAYVRDKATDVWNALGEGNKEIDCSDSLKSILSSLHTKSIHGLQSADSSAAGFGAQTSLFADAPDDDALIAPASEASTRDASEATDDKDRVPEPSSSKKRRRETPTGSHEKPGKKTRAARPRHQDSQIFFVAIPAGASTANESQHLTENQMDVRQRQREQALLYSDMGTSSPQDVAEETTKTGKHEQVGSGQSPAVETTPRKERSFDDLISSTPTPRRGQTLPVIDMNDPPSSPPVPRPYPLLSEIQSRSRSSADINSWEFSSPTTSPITKHQRAPERSASVTSNQDFKFAKENEEQQAVHEAHIHAAEPHNNGGAHDEAVDMDMSPKEAAPVSTKPDVTSAQYLHLSNHQTQESTNLVDDDLDEEFVDARSNPALSSPISRSVAADKSGAEKEIKVASFEISEIEEDHFEHLLTEVEARCKLQGASRAQHESEGDEDPTESQIVVATEELPLARCSKRERYTPSPSKGSGRTRRQKWTSPVSPRTPTKVTGQDEGSGSKHKRKRGEKRHHDVRSSKRRRSITSVSNQSAEGKTGSLGPELSPCARKAPAKAVRRSLRHRKQSATDVQDLDAASSPASKASDRDKSNEYEGPEQGDTDEEVLSQLVTESAAASQQSHNSQPAPLGVVTRAQTLAGASVAGINKSAPADEERARDGKTGIIKTLRSGLDQLRKAALGREAVYELEDVLMDIKRELYEAELRGRRKGGSFAIIH
ncbi:hypothetical protein CDD81_4512 [Ophiocordyceps australis]|uniref:Telomere-associated protein Rif1 N-terminal domain-containing protein n=1 Tax=Ophiocordyceps australis TaxID=1399860 RepID=A0A2C5YEG4_9HYPO|nr:hypothetical protein CDD81_4512 [Ophiocordyceps australis]